MAVKRKSRGRSKLGAESHTSSRYDLEETFDDSEDEFYAKQDKVLLDDTLAAKRIRRLEEQEQYLQASDEEILRYDSESDLSEVDVISDDDDDNLKARNGGSDAEENKSGDDQEHWGTTRADYYDADAIETEQDAFEEAQEAARLQQKQLQEINETDFGFDEIAWAEPNEHDPKPGPLVEKLPGANIPVGASAGEQLGILRSRYPEFEPLAKDFINLQPQLALLQDATKDKRCSRSVLLKTKIRALSAYLGSIAMYFAILSSDTKPATENINIITALNPSSLRGHSVIANIAKSRHLWDAVRDIVVEDAAKPIHKRPAKPKETAHHVVKAQPEKAISPSIQAPLLPPKETPAPVKSKQANKTSKYLNLDTLLSQSTVPQLQTESDFGDEAPLNDEEVAEKARKRKSLRFYTSQIAQKANKRGTAAREAGGDDDLPRKERLRDKQERLLKEAERRGREKPTHEELLEGSDGASDQHADEDDEYYRSLAMTRDSKKADKKARAEAYAQAAKDGGTVYEEETLGPDGKRAITYAIEKNKGLMPKRKKDVRNPRVKKRKKFDEKKKKLSSIRQVYKGGEGRGGYGGELTGIKTNVVKSVKL